MSRIRFVLVMTAASLSAAVTLRAPAESPLGAKDGPVAKAIAALYEGIRQETLPNGLRVYLKPIPEAPTVTVMTAYCVGSADEDLNHTGLSHYLEHLMFKGTERLKPGDIDRLTRQGGGQNNAYTTEDFTNFHFDFAADRWETALAIEADRMRNLRIDTEHEFEKEKGAVINELIGDEDEPYDLEKKAILPLLFGPKSPYGHPIIGQKQQVKDSTAEIIKSHYDKWYHPNNAVIVIVGGFDPDRALAKIKELFGPIPKVELQPRKAVPPVERTKPVSVEIKSKFEADRCIMGFNTCEVGDPDDYVLDVIEHVLSSGKTGRLYRELVLDQEVAGEVTCSNRAGKRPGWFEIDMEVMKGDDDKMAENRKKAEKSLLAELERLTKEPLSKDELRRVVRSVIAGMIFKRESAHDLADEIVTAVATRDIDYAKTYLTRIQAVTPEDVERVAKKYFDPNKRVAVWSIVPQDRQSDKGQKKKPGGAGPDKAQRWSNRPARPHDKDPARSNVAGSSVDLTKATRAVLKNGLTVLLLENHRLPIVFAEAHVNRVHLYEPADKAGLVTLIGLLLEEGTDRHGEKEIAQSMENVGGQLSMYGNGGSVKVLSPDRSLGLGMLLECLARSEFARKSVERLREHLLSEIEDNRQSPNASAQEEFRREVYGDHPLGRSEYGTEENVKKLSREDCRDFHRRIYVPNNTALIVVGDFETKTVIDEISEITKDWKSRDLPKLDLPVIQPLKESTLKIIAMPDAAQVNVFMGHLGIKRDNPDYYKLLVMDNILGVGTGFTDRLSSELRDREGLAYTVTASITSTAGEEPGLFSAFIGCEAADFSKAKDLMLKEFKRIRDEKPTNTEVEETKNYLIGAMPFKLATNEDLADQLLLIERYHLGLDYPSKFRAAISAVTADDVNAVARKYLHPDRMATVAAGPLIDAGNPKPKTDKSDR